MSSASCPPLHAPLKRISWNPNSNQDGKKFSIMKLVFFRLGVFRTFRKSSYAVYHGNSFVSDCWKRWISQRRINGMGHGVSGVQDLPFMCFAWFMNDVQIQAPVVSQNPMPRGTSSASIPPTSCGFHALETSKRTPRLLYWYLAPTSNQFLLLAASHYYGTASWSHTRPLCRPMDSWAIHSLKLAAQLSYWPSACSGRRIAPNMLPLQCKYHYHYCVLPLPLDMTVFMARWRACVFTAGVVGLEGAPQYCALGVGNLGSFGL